MTIEYGSMMLQGQQEYNNHHRPMEMFQAPTNYAPSRNTTFDFPSYLVGTKFILKSISFHGLRRFYSYLESYSI